MEVKTDALRRVEHKCDFCVVGGGLSGMAAALSAARRGVKVVLIHDRPVLGGNCSSEIRMWVRGARGEENRETGIISELEQENIYRNPRLNYSIWDSVLWGTVKAEPNIELLMNCSVCDADTDDGRISCVRGWQLTTYTWHTVYADYFADCSGDSILAPIVGAQWRVGREGNSDFNETLGPVVADKKTMGMSCLIQCRETDHRVDFIPPEWANVYLKDSDFDYSPPDNHDEIIEDADFGYSNAAKKAHECFRTHNPETSGANFWWIELGGEFDSIHDTELMRDELLKVAFGVWDHIKNHDEDGSHHAENWQLEWVGFLPGKRESRRYVGAHTLTQKDIEDGGRFDDIIAYGGWTMDDHNPAGVNSKSNQPPSRLYPTPSPYGIPYRVLYSKNIKNLFFAGRNISATHAAISSTRVMATCSLLGQAMGVAAALCVNDKLTPDEVYEKEIRKLQAELLDDGCFLPGRAREIPALSLNARLNLTDADRDLLFNGLERPDAAGTVNYITLNAGDSIDFDFGKKTKLSRLRLMFDPDFSRRSISVNRKMRVFTQKCCEGLDFRPVTVADTLVRGFEVYADGKLVFCDNNNYFSLRRIPLDLQAEKLSVKFTSTRGSDKVHIFSCDVS